MENFFAIGTEDKSLRLYTGPQRALYRKVFFSIADILRAAPKNHPLLCVCRKCDDKKVLQNKAMLTHFGEL